MQIKTTMRQQYRSIRIAKIWNTDNTTCWQGLGTENLIHYASGIVTLEYNSAVSYKTKDTLTVQSKRAP